MKFGDIYQDPRDNEIVMYVGEKIDPSPMLDWNDKVLSLRSRALVNRNLKDFIQITPAEDL